MNEIDTLREQLKQTEMALEEAISTIENTRVMLREQVQKWYAQGLNWRWIKSQVVWKAFIKLGGS